MASKKQTETGAPPTMIKKRYLNDADCKKAAARISQEMRDYPAHMKLFRARRLPDVNRAVVIPLWGPDLDAVTAKVEHLYHEDEAAIIIAALTA